MTCSAPTPPSGRRRRGERGAGLVEYVLMVSLIALVCLSAVAYFGSRNEGGLSNSASSIIDAGTP